MAKTRRTLLAPVRSLFELHTLARENERYRALACVACDNLGGHGESLERAMLWLSICAAETSERGIVAEVNWCRDLVSEVCDERTDTDAN